MADVFNRFALDHARRKRYRTTDPNGSSVPPPDDPAGQDLSWPITDQNRPAPEVAPQPPEVNEVESTATYIRPYAWTGGRTRSNYRLEVETLVSTSDSCHAGRLQRVEHHSIAGICQHPRSVAEVGAMLGVPLGVAKVLLGDMADLGLVTVHNTVTENGSTSHLQLMERVLSGLRRL
ncbi:DUF742 domain-containing protein [Saccharopolyspora montiporae]|nr:DUF742 domain-containing protein [Saccharopolyspora sp. HNM0983]